MACGGAPAPRCTRPGRILTHRCTRRKWIPLSIALFPEASRHALPGRDIATWCWSMRPINRLAKGSPCRSRGIDTMTSPVTTKRHILAATPTCFLGFDPWVAYGCFQRAGIRHVEVLAFPAAMGIKFGLTTFAPESMNAQDVQLLRERLQGMQLTPLTVAA